MSTQEPLFIPASFFMTRTPLLAIEEFFSILKQQNPSDTLINRFRNDLSLHEGLAIASSSLSNALIDPKDRQQVSSSLLKYFLRSSTRCTPFGLFSFVALGQFDNTTHVSFDISKVHKRARPDMEWLFAVIDNLSKDSQLFPHLTLKTNHFLFESGGRIFLNYVRKGKVEEDTKTISIRSSFLVSCILELAKQPLTIEQLVEKVVELYPALNREKVEGVIKQLLQQQFLFFTLQPSLFTDSPIKDLLSKLNKIPFPADLLKKVSKNLDLYNSTSLGNGLEFFKLLKNDMKEIANASHFLQVDMAHKESKNTLPKYILKDLSAAAEILWQLSDHSQSFYPLKNYHERFLEKYGIYRTVPLLELLNEECGLGLPDIYTNNHLESFSPKNKTNKWKQWLRHQWILALHENKREIEITDEILEFLNNSNKNKSLNSFDLFCQIIANSPLDIDIGNYLLLITHNSSEAGATFGRFLDLLGDQSKQLMKQLYVQEENLEKNNLFVQASFLSFIPRNANVSIHQNLRKHVMDLSSSDLSTISLDDIYVGAMNDRLYLTTKTNTQEVIVTSGNMLVTTVNPSPLRLMRDISSSRHQTIFPFSWMDLENSPFLPRIRYKKIVFSPARWRIDPFELNLNPKDNLQTIDEKFKCWKEKWKMPRYVFMGENDQQILIDLEHPACRKEVIQQLKNGQIVLLNEKIGQEQGQWVQTQTGIHLTEFVVPFIKNPKYSPDIKKTILEKYKKISTQERWKLPGSEWLFVKCYMSQQNENRFLVDHCQHFVNFLKSNKFIEDWFFIRYSDPKSHIRLRFRGNPQNITEKVLPALHDWSQRLLEKNYINEITIGSYEREVERYGGPMLIEHAERLFHADSLTVFDLIDAKINKKISFPEEVIATLGVIDLLKEFGLTPLQQCEFFASLEMQTEELKGFREYKTELLKLVPKLFQNNLQENETIILKEALDKRRLAIHLFANQMKVEPGLTSSKTIYSSVIHMYCNRYLGRDRHKELKAYLFAHHILKSIIAKNSKK